MNILIRQAEIIDEQSPYHKQRKNILISHGLIAGISDQETEADVVIESDDLKVSVGWFDMWCQFGDPGHEYKEDLESGCRAAAAGGFTDVALLPNTNPAVQYKNAVTYLKSRNPIFLTQVHPIGAVSPDIRGEDITEMIDMYEAGAVAFSDGIKPIWNTDILLKTLLYLKKFNGLTIQRPEDKWLNTFGTMNESVYSARLGLKGMPAIAEELIIERDLRLLEYAGSRLHFANISTAGSVEAIRQAKRRGLQVTCDIAAHQIAFDDEDLETFDTNLKVNPPFRGGNDIEALIGGLEDGTIDVVVSSHQPHDEESKKLEFDLAEFGMTGLQTVFPLINSLTDRIGLDRLINKITYAPRQLLGIAHPLIKENEKACLTAFDPGKKWKFTRQVNQSRSVNTPFLNQELTGKTLATINNNQHWINE